jgi:hypothetical protein
MIFSVSGEADPRGGNYTNQNRKMLFHVLPLAKGSIQAQPASEGKWSL